MIRTRNDLMAYLEEHAPQGCIRRAVSEGRAENLGGFTTYPPGTTHWMIKVTSKRDKVWYLYVLNHYLVDNPKPILLSKPLFRHWVGNGGEPSLMNGDNPLLYKELRDKELKDV